MVKIEKNYVKKKYLLKAAFKKPWKQFIEFVQYAVKIE